MTPIPEVQPLPQTQRRIIFILSLLVFIVSVPMLVFYAIGYRFDFTDAENNITGVGGMYVTAQAQDVDIYIDQEPVKDMRIFQNAAYIQNLTASTYKVHTQAPELQTWSKELPVFPYLVTEVQSFNIPTTSQVRAITPYSTQAGDSVLFESATSTVFANASTTNVFFIATTTATSTFIRNLEFAYVETLFASSSQERALLAQQKALEKKNLFRFDTRATTSSSSLVATTTKLHQDMQLIEIGEEVYAQWTGPQEDIPYYFCIKYTDATTTISTYGQHIYDSLVAEYGTTTNFSNGMYTTGKLCRTQIRIDRLWQEVQWFDFVPGSRDLVLMQLEDGLYVVEIDDRAWQNTQLLYAGDSIQVVLDGGRIFIKDGSYYMEVFTTLQQ